MEDLKQVQDAVQRTAFHRIRMVLIAYGFCLLLALAGVVLGAINFASGPVHYPGFVLVLWLLADIILFAIVALHLLFYGIDLGRHDDGDLAYTGMYCLFIVLPLTWAGIALLVNKHFGWFSAGALAALIVCGVIDALMIAESRK